MKAMNQQQGFMNWFHAAAKAKVRTLLLYNMFMDTMKTVNEFGPNPTICVPNNYCSEYWTFQYCP
jgi:hypothetical protein